MSSLRKSPRVRPKSPPLQPPRPAPISAAPIKMRMRARGDLVPEVRIGRHISGIFKRPSSGAPTATAAGGCTFFRSAPIALVGWAFDPDNGQDQYRPHAVA